jgi:predicted lipoprotein
MTNPQAAQNADGNTPKWFVATVCWEQRSLAYLRIQANSLEEAEEKADEFKDETDERDYHWNPVHGDTWVESVKPDDGMKSYYFSRAISLEETSNPNDGGQDND